MSLSSLLARKEVRNKFSEYVIRPRLKLDNTLLAPPLTKNYGLVGTAFDYLLRFYIKHLNPEVTESSWVAEVAVDEMERKKLYIFQKAFNQLSETKEMYLSYLQSGEITHELLRSIIIISKFDIYYRSGFIDENIEFVNNDDITDLIQQYNLLKKDQWKTKERGVLNPTFGRASSLVGGADADVIIDDMIIDIKAIKKLELKIDDFQQLIGYYLLSVIGRINSYPKGYKINKLGIYFSRYGLLHHFDLQEVIKQDTFTEFKDWFVSEAKTQYRIPDAVLAQWRKVGFNA